MSTYEPPPFGLLERVRDGLLKLPGSVSDGTPSCGPHISDEQKARLSALRSEPVRGGTFFYCLHFAWAEGRGDTCPCRFRKAKAYRRHWRRVHGGPA